MGLSFEQASVESLMKRKMAGILTVGALLVSAGTRLAGIEASTLPLASAASRWVGGRRDGAGTG